MTPTEADDIECGKLYLPSSAYDDYTEYWNRMLDEGYWQNGRWTEKGWKEILRHA